MNKESREYEVLTSKLGQNLRHEYFIFRYAMLYIG